jgi:hypothetical protein
MIASQEHEAAHQRSPCGGAEQAISERKKGHRIVDANSLAQRVSRQNAEEKEEPQFERPGPPGKSTSWWNR